MRKQLYLRKEIFLFIFVLFSSIALNRPVYAQNSISDTSATQIRELPELFVTATRTLRKPEEIPARLATIQHSTINLQPVLTTDAILALLPGMNIDRPQGIFSKNASITMRGLSGSPRVLILVDGVPISKTDGGGVNWNRMVPENIDRIEVLKGPSSTVYGGNAMAGVINMITREPTQRLEGEAKIFFGSCNTFGGLLRLNGRLKSQGNSIYYGFSGFYRQGDGYVIVPESTRDSMDVDTYLYEGSLNAKVGYRYRGDSYTEIEYNYYNDKRGDGTRIYEPEGGYNRYPTNYVRLTTSNHFSKFSWILRAFYQNEHYLRQSETMSEKRGKKYTLYQTDAYRIDQGVWTNLSYKPAPGMEATFGFDLKQGSVDGKDIYYTSTDIMHNTGKMNFLALFAAYDWQPFNKKLSILAGIRYDVARFFDGAYSVEAPTTLTAFMTSYPTNFSDATWDDWSPKLGLKYRFSMQKDIYLSYSHGFRPGMLDDMCRNGNISKGFKLANPQLQPENVDNFEVGSTLTFLNKLTLEPSIYYTVGTDFHYFVGNGDSISTGGDNLKPVLQRQNVSEVQVAGAEINLSWQISRNFFLSANYAYNHSTITKFDTAGKTGKELTGKYLMEVPRNQAFGGIYYNSRLFQASVVFSYKGEVWSDDENTAKTPAYSTFDLKIGKTFLNRVNISMVIQDIFDTEYYDSKGNLSPGRFIMFNLAYKISKTNQ